MAKKTKSVKGSLVEAEKLIKKKYGKLSIMRLGDKESIDIDTLPTGILSLDKALGVGGLPRGRAVEIFGDEASGKTTLSLCFLAKVQELGGKGAFIDVEHAIDVKYAERIGVNLNELLFAQPNSAEEALDICEKLVESDSFDAIVLDSVAALSPQVELDATMGDKQIALQARLMAQAMRKLTSKCNKARTSVIFLNQTKTKIGVRFGNPVTTAGGRALKFHASIRISVNRSQSEKVKDKIVASRFRFKVVKNKVAAPFEEGHFFIQVGKNSIGPDKIRDIIDTGVETKLIKKATKGYVFKKQNFKLADLKDFLSSKPKTREKLIERIRERFNNE